MPTVDGNAPRRRFREALGTAAFSLLAATVLLTHLGYSFERHDQLQYLLLPYREIFDHFMPRDWCTWQTTHYHHSYAFFVRALAWLGGTEHLPESVFVAHFVVLLLLGASFWSLSRAAGHGAAGAFMALLVMAMLREDALAGAKLNHGQLVPADMAFPPFLLACAASLRRRWLATGLWLGLSGLMHANFAVLGAMVLLPLQLVDGLRARDLRPVVGTAAVFALVAAPTLFTVVSTFLAHDSAPEALDVVLRVRSPHHYDLSAMRPEDFWWVALLALGNLPLWLRRGSPDGAAAEAPAPEAGGDIARRRERLLLALGACLLIALLGSLASVRPLIRLFGWRMSVPLCALLAMGLGDLAARAVPRRDLTRGLWIAGAVAALLPFARSDVAQIDTLGGPGAFFAVVPAVTLLAGGLASRALSAGQRRAAVALAALVVVGWSAQALSQPRLVRSESGGIPELAAVRGPRLSKIELRHEAHRMSEVMAKLDRDALFLIPPGRVYLRLASRRAVYVDWKCVPMRGDEAREWRRRMLEVMGTDDFPARGYQLRRESSALYMARDLEELAEIARRHDVDYIIHRRGSRPPPGSGLIAGPAAGPMRVFRVAADPGREGTR
jgi:hypothetical protein